MHQFLIVGLVSGVDGQQVVAIGNWFWSKLDFTRIFKLLLITVGKNFRVNSLPIESDLNLCQSTFDVVGGSTQSEAGFG